MKKLWLTLLLCVGCLAAQARISHRYTFDGTLEDSGEKKHGKPAMDGVHIELPQFVADIPLGAVEGAPSKSVQLGMDASKKSGFTLPPIRTYGSGSCSIWLKPETLSGGNYIFQSKELKLMVPKGTLDLRLSCNGGDFQGNVGAELGRWIHVVVTWNHRSSNTLSYYVNGALIASKKAEKLTDLTSIQVGNYDLRNNAKHLENQFKGKLYDLQFYNHSLDAQQVEYLYANPGAKAVGEPEQPWALPDVFSDNMILQRNAQIPVWGTAIDGTVVTVTFAGHNRETTARNRKWKVIFPAMKANKKPQVMTVVARHKSEIINREFNNILIGDVWLASGQSNMAYPLFKEKHGKETLATSKNPLLRFFKVRREIPFSADSLPSSGHWEEAAPDSIVTKCTTAVGYHFARELQEKVDIPIGLINCSYGGTVTETWCSPEVLSQDYPLWDKHEENMRKNPNSMKVNRSAHLYERMLKTVIPFPVKGFIWYQGSANTGRYEEQKRLLPAMANDWRKSWGNDELPFYFVQLPRFETQNWHVFREAQLDIWKNNPNTFMAVAIDISKEYDDNNNPIHPNTKAPIGHRLALAARANVYGETDLVYSGPVIKSMKVKNGTAILSFDHMGSGLIASDRMPLRGFYISEGGETFVAAEARIKGDTVVVSATTVQKPVAVRYGADLDMGKEKLDVNLANKEKLPASPFTIRTGGRVK